jgi:hypothetical protein
MKLATYPAVIDSMVVSKMELYTWKRGHVILRLRLSIAIAIPLFL